MELFTCQDVAKMFKVKQITVWDWIRRGKLSAYKIGKMYRISQAQIDAFVTSQK